MTNTILSICSVQRLRHGTCDTMGREGQPFIEVSQVLDLFGVKKCSVIIVSGHPVPYRLIFLSTRPCSPWFLLLCELFVEVGIPYIALPSGFPWQVEALMKLGRKHLGFLISSLTLVKLKISNAKTI